MSTTNANVATPAIALATGRQTRVNSSAAAMTAIPNPMTSQPADDGGGNHVRLPLTVTSWPSILSGICGLPFRRADSRCEEVTGLVDRPNHQGGD